MVTIRKNTNIPNHQFLLCDSLVSIPAQPNLALPPPSRILDKPIEIQVGGRSVVCSDVIQKVLIVDEENKLFKLLELLGEFQAKGSCIIFVDKQVRRLL